jgi:hypothetical protein
LDKLEKTKPRGAHPSVSRSEQRLPGPRRAPSNSGSCCLARAHGFPTAISACRSRPPFPPPCHYRPPPRAALRGAHHRRSSSFLLLSFMPCLCSPHCSPLSPLHSTSTPSSAQATPLSRSTILKRCFYLEPAAVKSPQSHPMLCVVSTESASTTAAISSHRPPSVSPPRGPHRCPDPLRPASRRR